MIVTGAKNEEDCYNGARKYTAIIQKIGIPVTMNDFKVQNITATFDIGTVGVYMQSIYVYCDLALLSFTYSEL